MWVRSNIIDEKIKSNKEIGSDIWLDSYNRVKKEIKVRELVTPEDMINDVEMVEEPMLNEFIEERNVEIPTLNRIVERLRDLDLPNVG